MALITQPDYESVRKLIDTKLTASNLPDAVIGLIDYEGEAERWVARQTSNTDASAKRAARAYLAILLIPAIRRVIKESNAGYSYELDKVNWDDRCAYLLEMANKAICDSEEDNPTDVGEAYLLTLTQNNFDVASSGLSDKFLY